MAGPPAAGVSGPLMEPGGGLAGSVGAVTGAGAARGMALMYILAGGALIGVAAASFNHAPGPASLRRAAWPGAPAGSGYQGRARARAGQRRRQRDSGPNQR